MFDVPSLTWARLPADTAGVDADEPELSEWWRPRTFVCRQGSAGSHARHRCFPLAAHTVPSDPATLPSRPASQNILIFLRVYVGRVRVRGVCARMCPVAWTRGVACRLLLLSRFECAARAYHTAHAMTVEEAPHSARLVVVGVDPVMDADSGVPRLQVHMWTEGCVVTGCGGGWMGVGSRWGPGVGPRLHPHPHAAVVLPTPTAPHRIACALHAVMARCAVCGVRCAVRA